MLDLAISFGSDLKGGTVIETNCGATLTDVNWPQDCDFQMVAFDPVAENCEVVWAETLADDIQQALLALDGTKVMKGRRPAWYYRLALCAKGAVSEQTP